VSASPLLLSGGEGEGREGQRERPRSGYFYVMNIVIIIIIMIIIIISRWKSALMGDAEIDTQKVDSTCKLEDYDEGTQVSPSLFSFFSFLDYDNSPSLLHMYPSPHMYPPLHMYPPPHTTTILPLSLFLSLSLSHTHSHTHAYTHAYTRTQSAIWKVM
jgi:hypothetical protein